MLLYSYSCTLTILIILTKRLLNFVYVSESNLAEPGLWHAARPSGHLSVLLCGEDLGRTGGTVPAPHRMEGQSGWPQIHRTAGQQPHTTMIIVNIYLYNIYYVLSQGSLCGRNGVQST